MKHSQIILGTLMALTTATYAMPTEEATRKVEPVVLELMHDDQVALKDGKKTPAEVADSAMALAKKADTEAAKLLLLKGAFNLYVRAGDHDKAIGALQTLQTAIPDLPPANMANIISAGKISGLYKVLAERRVEETRKRLAAKAHPDGLLFYCTFDDESAITTPAVGPAGKIDNKPTFVPGKVGKAVQNLPEQRSAIFMLPEGTFGERGCVEVWAKLANPDATSLRNHGDPALFVIRTPEGPAEGAEAYINWNGNDGCGGRGLCGWVAAGRFSTGIGRRRTSSVYSGILGDKPDDWHHYAMSWDIKGIDKSGHQALIFVDGRIVATIGQISPHKIAIFAKRPHELDIPGINGPMQRGSVAIDELRMWNTPKTSFDLH